MVGVAKTITSDQGSCFTAQMSTIFMNELGCTPRFSTALHPEGNSLVERLNQSVKKMLHHVVRDKPKQWTKLLPYVLWCIRESRNETLGTSPFAMVYGRLPVTPLDMLVESWEGHSELPATFGRSPVEILSELQQTLEHIHDEARTHSEREQRRHATFYNLKAKDKHFDVGQMVIVLLPDSTNKLMSRWQGPATVVEMKSPYSYLIELPGGQRRVLHANKLRSYHVRFKIDCLTLKAM